MMTKKIEVEVQFLGGDFYIYTFHSEILAAGFAKDVFKHGATFVRNNAYHTYSPTAVLCTKVRINEDEQVTESPTPKRKAEKHGGSGKRPPANNRAKATKD
jgi:hypothetical protein